MPNKDLDVHKAAYRILYLIEEVRDTIKNFHLYVKQFQEADKKLHEAELHILQILDVAEIENKKEAKNVAD